MMMTNITSISSTKVNDLRHSIFDIRYSRLSMGLSILLFEAFRQPLLDHALVVEIAGARDSFQPREHSRVESYGNGCGIRLVGPGQSLGHHAGIELVFLPELRLGLLVGEGGDIGPLLHLVHGRQNSLTMSRGQAGFGQDARGGFKGFHCYSSSAVFRS